MTLVALILFIILFIFLLYMQIQINSSINIILLNSSQLKDRQNALYDKLVQSNKSIYFKIVKLETQVDELNQKINLLENIVINFGLQINTHESKMTKLIDEVLKREDLRYENKKLKMILKRQNRTQPPR